MEGYWASSDQQEGPGPGWLHRGRVEFEELNLLFQRILRLNLDVGTSNTLHDSSPWVKNAWNWQQLRKQLFQLSPCRQLGSSCSKGELRRKKTDTILISVKRSSWVGLSLVVWWFGALDIFCMVEEVNNGQKGFLCQVFEHWSSLSFMPIEQQDWSGPNKSCLIKPACLVILRWPSGAPKGSKVTLSRQSRGGEASLSTDLLVTPRWSGGAVQTGVQAEEFLLFLFFATSLSSPDTQRAIWRTTENTLPQVHFFPQFYHVFFSSNDQMVSWGVATSSIQTGLMILEAAFLLITLWALIANQLAQLSSESLQKSQLDQSSQLSWHQMTWLPPPSSSAWLKTRSAGTEWSRSL